MEKALPEALDLVSKNRKAIIITGKSLATKTQIIKNVEKILGDAHVGTFSHIGQHAPVKDIRAVVDALKAQQADVLVAVGGGSPIDSAKAVSFFIHEESQKNKDDERSFLPIIAIPTTLSVAETTQNAGYTSDEGKKVGQSNPALVPRVIIYDGEAALQTPERLWLSSGMRAVDHAIELLYRPGFSIATQGIALSAVRDLFHLLPASKAHPQNVSIRQRLQIACFDSLWPESRTGALGLSHGLGHALGATYGIPHGITSCLTLPSAIRIMAQLPTTSKEHLLNLSDALNFIPPHFYSDAKQDILNVANPPPSLLMETLSAQELDNEVLKARSRGMLVAQAVDNLIDELGLHSTLREYNVPKEDIHGIAQFVSRGKDEQLAQKVVAELTQKYDDKQRGGAAGGQL